MACDHLRCWGQHTWLGSKRCSWICENASTLRMRWTGFEIGKRCRQFYDPWLTVSKRYCSKRTLFKDLWSKRQHEHEQTLPLESAKSTFWEGKILSTVLVNCSILWRKMLVRTRQKTPWSMERGISLSHCWYARENNLQTITFLRLALERDDEWARDVYYST